MITHIVNVIHSVVREHVSKVLSSKRSSKWPRVRKQFLKINNCCAACKSTTLLQVHHIVPFHYNSALELDPTNFITLCMSKNECHYKLGHGGSFKAYNPYVKEDCTFVLDNPSKLIVIQAKAELYRKVNAPGN